MKHSQDLDYRILQWISDLEQFENGSPFELPTIEGLCLAIGFQTTKRARLVVYEHLQRMKDHHLFRYANQHNCFDGDEPNKQFGEERIVGLSFIGEGELESLSNCVRTGCGFRIDYPELESEEEGKEKSDGV